jgi:dolichol-phosphate mannosyltransferase
MEQPKIAVILPALNEEEALGKLIAEMPTQQLEQEGYLVQIVIADNNSTDQTRTIAEQNNATVIIEPRRGKGFAVEAGLKSVEADFIFILDADYTYPPVHILDMLKLLQNNHVVTGSRLKGRREKEAIPLFNLIGNYLLSLLATVVYQRRVSDVCTGYWGLRGDVVRNLSLKATGFELEVRLFSELIRRGYTIAELPIYYRRRIGGRPKLRPVKDGIKIAWTLLTGRFNRLDDGLDILHDDG